MCSGERVKKPVPDSDATVRIVPVRRLSKPRQSWGFILVAGVAILVVAIGAAWLVWPRQPAVPPTPLPPATVSTAPLAIQTAGIDRIRANKPTDLSIFRLAENPNIAVLDFASLARQRAMLDRIAALIEKSGQPRDRILTPSDLDLAIRSEGDPDAGFYYGHDYSAASLIRFFAIAKRDHVELTPEETILGTIIANLGWTRPDALGGLISLPRAGANANVTMAARDTILTHELSHGEYFSDPHYAAYVHAFFQDVLTDTEQRAFRSFLGNDGYDTGNAILMENETQAYLLFTPDPRFFDLTQVHMSPNRRAALRVRFLSGMPAGWLKDLLSSLP